MELAEELHELARTEAYPYPVEQVQLIHTHISAVFLAGDFVYKIKKPVDFGFLDFSTLEKRKHFCEEEVRLNRRLAPEVYLGVVPIARDGEHLRFEASGTPVEYAVKMKRLNPAQTFESLLENGRLDEAGYVEVRTPQLVDRKLWEKSGHWEKFGEHMYTTESEERTFALKPMNCPGL